MSLNAPSPWVARRLSSPCACPKPGKAVAKLIAIATHERSIAVAAPVRAASRVIFIVKTRISVCGDEPNLLGAVGFRRRPRFKYIYWAASGLVQDKIAARESVHAGG